MRVVGTYLPESKLQGCLSRSRVELNEMLCPTSIFICDVGRQDTEALVNDLCGGIQNVSCTEALQ